ncbi:hypothetical protein Tco_0001402 [Tanacetum coccineum]
MIGAEQAPPSLSTYHFVRWSCYPEFLPGDDEDLEEDDEEDPEEDPADYPADRGDDDDEHIAPADPAAVAYSADQDPYLAYRVTARMSIRTQAPTPFLSEEVAERVLALPTPPPSPLSPYSSPLPHIPSPPLPIPPPISPTYVDRSLGSRAARIRQRDALPSHVHETEMPEMCLPLRKRLCRTTPGPGYEVGESSAAGTARRVGPTTARTDLYGFADTLEAAPGRRMSRELGYGIRDTWDDLVGAIQEIAPTTLEGGQPRDFLSCLLLLMRRIEIIYSQLLMPGNRWMLLTSTHSEGIVMRTTVMAQQSEIVELRGSQTEETTVAFRACLKAGLSDLADGQLGEDPNDREEHQGSDDREMR